MCDELGPADVQSFFDRWSAKLPWPLTTADGEAGFEQYKPGKMTYDLRRLSLKGLIHRVPKTHGYVVTSYGLKVALFYAKVYLRIVRPGWAAIGEPPDDIPRPLRGALEQVGIEIALICEEAQIRPAA